MSTPLQSLVIVIVTDLEVPGSTLEIEDWLRDAVASYDCPTFNVIIFSQPISVPDLPCIFIGTWVLASTESSGVT